MREAAVAPLPEAVLSVPPLESAAWSCTSASGPRASYSGSPAQRSLPPPHLENTYFVRNITTKHNHNVGCQINAGFMSGRSRVW